MTRDDDAPEPETDAQPWVTAGVQVHMCILADLYVFGLLLSPMEVYYVSYIIGRSRVSRLTVTRGPLPAADAPARARHASRHAI